jgi:hypothetical protein
MAHEKLAVKHIAHQHRVHAAECFPGLFNDMDLIGCEHEVICLKGIRL